MRLTKWVKNLSWRIVLLAFLFAVILSGFSTAASSISEGCGWFSLPLSGLAPRFFGYIAMFMVILLVCLFAADTITNRDRNSKQRSNFFVRVFVPEWRWSSICLSAAIMFALWVPWLLAFYPASMNWDTYYQIAMFSGETPVWVIPYGPTGSIVDHAFSDHHPFFDTLIYGAFAQFGRILSGDWNLGVFLFVLIQASGMAISFTASISYFAKKGCPCLLLVAVYLFFALIPFIPAWAGTMVKDTLFSWLYVPYFLLLYMILSSRGKIDQKAVALFIVLGLLLCLTKKTGPYIVIPTAIAFALFYRKGVVYCFAQAILSIVLMWVVLPQLVFPAFDVIPGGKQEALGALFQQTARYVVDHPDEVTQQEKEVIDAVIGYDDLAARYDYLNADTVKFWYRYNTVTDEDMRNYYEVWLTQGLRHPGSYISSWLATSGSYFAESGTLNLLESTSDVEHSGTELLSRPGVFNSLRCFLLNSYHSAKNVPIVNYAFSVALYSFLIPACSLFVAVCRRRDLLPLFIPVLLSLASCAMTPCFDTRYALPLIYTAPLLVCAVLTVVQGGKRSCLTSDS